MNNYGTQDIIIGVYDKVGSIAETILTSSEAPVFIVSTNSHHEIGRSIESESFDKEFFLNRSTHAVVVVTDMASISFLAGTLDRLFAGSIRAVMVISQFFIADLLTDMMTPEEANSFYNSIEEGRCLICNSFDPTNLHALLRVS